MTPSGGEPTVHMGYLSAVLRGLRREGIHVVLQTCGAFRFERSEALVYPHVDLVHFDIKLLDDDAHRAHCGASNGTILDNFGRLQGRALAGGVDVLPRIPLMPGVTDTPQNLEAIAAWLRDLRVEAVQLMPYNPLWPEKAPKLGLPPPAPGSDLRWLEPDELERCRAIFERASLQVVD